MSLHTPTRTQPRAAHRSPQPPARLPRVLPGAHADHGAILIHATQAAILGVIAILIVLGASTLAGRTHAATQGGRGASSTVHTDGTTTGDH